MKVLLILNDPPYGTERCYNGLRLANALVKNDSAAEVTVFLMADAVACGKKGQKTPDGYYSLERMLKRFATGTSPGSAVRHLPGCARMLTRAELIDGARREFTMDELARDAAPRVRTVRQGASGMVLDSARLKLR